MARGVWLRLVGFAALVTVSLADDAGAQAVGVSVVAKQADRRVDVRIDGDPFTSWVWPESLTKPVLVPIRTEKGTRVTRGFPLEPVAGERVDHPHHVGLWLSYGDVNGVDFWNNSSALGPDQQARMGRHVQTRILAAESGKVSGTLSVAMEWRMPDGSVALDEEATMVFGRVPRGRFIERTSILSAREKPVALGDNKEGLLGLRVARWLEQPSNEALILTDGSGRPTSVPALDNTSVTGLYRTSEGKEGDAIWATRGRWASLSGRTGEEDVTIAILDDPKNPGAPTYWHARGYGLFAANPLGQKAFSQGREALDLALAPGQKARFRWRVLVLSTTFDAKRLDEEWRSFAEGR